MSFVWSLMDPENLLRLGLRVSHFSLPGPPSECSRTIPVYSQELSYSYKLQFFFRKFFMWLCFYQLKFGYATWIFCQIIGEGKGVLNSKAFVHIILTSHSSARDKNAYQEPIKISRTGREREVASHFCFTEVLPCTQDWWEEWDRYLLSNNLCFDSGGQSGPAAGVYTFHRAVQERTEIDTFLVMG